MSAEGVVGQREAIKISQFWEEELKKMPYMSSKSILDFIFIFLSFS